VFPSDLVDLLLEKNQIEKIAQESDTTILVKTECLMRSTERIVRVSMKDFSSRSLMAFEKVVYLLAIQVQNNITLAMSAPGNEFYVEDRGDDVHRYIFNFDRTDDIVFHGARGIDHEEENYRNEMQYYDDEEEEELIDEQIEKAMKRLGADSGDSISSSKSNESSESTIEEEEIGIKVDEDEEESTHTPISMEQEDNAHVNSNNSTIVNEDLIQENTLEEEIQANEDLIEENAIEVEEGQVKQDTQEVEQNVNIEQEM
jgi:hypothetical protein